MINKKTKFNLGLIRLKIHDANMVSKISQDDMVDYINISTILAVCKYMGLEPIKYRLTPAKDRIRNKLYGGALFYDFNKKEINFIELNRYDNFGLYFYLGDMEKAIKCLDLIFHEVRHGWQLLSGFQTKEDVDNYIRLEEDEDAYRKQKIEADAIEYASNQINLFKNGKGAYKIICKHLNKLAEED